MVPVDAALSTTPTKPIPSKIYESLQMAPQRYVKPKKRIYFLRPRRKNQSDDGCRDDGPKDMCTPSSKKQSFACFTPPQKPLPLSIIKKLVYAPKRRPSTTVLKQQQQRKSPSNFNSSRNKLSLPNITWAPKKKFPYRKSIQITAVGK